MLIGKIGIFWKYTLYKEYKEGLCIIIVFSRVEKVYVLTHYSWLSAQAWPLVTLGDQVFEPESTLCSDNCIILLISQYLTANHWHFIFYYRPYILFLQFLWNRLILFFYSYYFWNTASDLIWFKWNFGNL